MASETGTASDYKDLLQKLKLFLTGAGSPESGLNWVVEEERSSFTSPITEIPSGDADELMEVASANNQAHDQMIFRGMGGTSPEKAIYFAIQTYGLSTTGYYNWHLRGLTGFAQNSPITDYVPLRDQPGRSPPAFLLLQNTTMTYWFVANERRIMGCVKTGTSYQPFYIGFLNPYATDAEYPYPMAVCGTAHTEATLFSSNNITTASPLTSGGGSSTQGLAVQGDLYPVNEASGWVRFTDGNWYAIKHYAQAGGNETALSGQSGAGLCHVYPQAQGWTSGPSYSARGNGAMVFQTKFRDVTPGDTPQMQMLPAFGSPELITMWPLTAYLPSPVGQLLGDFDGCYWVSGSGGVSSEDTITDFGESPEVTNIIFQNVHRTDLWTFLAMRFQ